MPNGSGGGDNRMNGEEVGGEDLRDLLEIGARREVRPVQVVCYRVKGEIGKLNLEERRDR